MFDGLLVSTAAIDQLEAFLAKPAHAMLLTGQKGIGLTSIATRLAQQLLHKNNLENEQYFRLLAPKDGTLAIETIRNLQSFFTLKVPGNSAVKRVVVIDSADAMTTEAQNALLKLLEEPPEGSVLLLVSSEPKRLLATIRSRLTSLTVSSPSKQKVLDWFTAHGYSTADIEKAYILSDGAISHMEAQLGGEGSSAIDTVRMVLAGKTFERLTQVEKLAKDKPAANEFVNSLVRVAAASLERAAAQNPGSLKRWQEVLTAGMTAQEALDRNGNTKLVLTDLMLTL